MGQIFISHVEEDAGTAIEIARGLEAGGYQTWYYEEHSDPGPSYLDQIDQALEVCQAVVLVISLNSLGSRQVEKEVEWAHECGKPIVPLLKGIKHEEFQKRRPKWRMALGTATSLPIPVEGVVPLLPRLLRGLKTMGIEPGVQPAAPPKGIGGRVAAPAVQRRQTSEPRAEHRPLFTQPASALAVGGVLALIVFVGLMILLVFLKGAGERTHDPRAVEGKGLPAAVEEMAKRLRGWDASPADEKAPQQVIDRFFGLLSLQEFHGELDGNHPDYTFVRRLPKESLSQGKTYTSEEELQQDLAKLATLLAKDSPDGSLPSGPSPSAKTLVEGIAGKMDYGRWWETRGNQMPFTGDDQEDEEIPRYIYRFCKPPEEWQQTDAAEMTKRLCSEPWRVQGVAKVDAEKRPRFVFQCFFNFLSRKRFVDPQLNPADWYVAFIMRLPPEPLGKGRTFNSEQELIDSLKQLAEQLQATTSPLASTLISNISESLDYKKWTNEKRKEGADYETEGVVALSIKQFVARFKSNSKRN